MSRILSILLFFCFFIMACNQPQTSTTKQETTTPPAAAPASTVVSETYLPSITLDELQHMWNICNQIDYIFYELPISSSVDNSPSAQAHLKHISDTPISLALKNQCGKAMGRVFYKAEGEDLIDAEIFFSGGCAFFVFYKKGKAVYSNLMTPAGTTYYNQIIATAAGAKVPTGK